MARPIDPHEETAAESIVPGTLSAGGQIGGYDLVEVLGEGGMGVVWRAHDPNLDREIAIKVLRRQDATPALRKRLLREGRAMARLKHPNVLTVYEVGTDADRDFIAMELVEGGSLDLWLAKQPPRAEVIAALLAAGRGLASAHAAGLVHRDFKPHNVLRSTEGRILVTDFGLARGLGDDAISHDGATPQVASRADRAGLDETLDASSSATPSSRSGNVRTDSLLDSPLTQTGALIGTPAYMAPEQFRGAAPDPRTDQFAYCVTAWQALTGARPFTGKDIDELRVAVTLGVAAIPADLPSQVRAALTRGLDPDPDRRWTDLDSLLTALERAVRPRRPRWVLPVIALGVLALVGGTALMTRRSNTAAGTSPGGSCEPADQVFADAWSDKLREGMWADFQARKVEISEDSFARVTVPFDELRKRWITSYAEACNAAPGAERAARIGCLLGARDQVSALTFLLKTGSATTFDHADPYGVLPNITVCNGPTPIAPPAIPPAKRLRVISVLAGALMLVASPRLAESIDRLEKEALDIGWEPLLSQVLTAGAMTYLARGELANARELFARAVPVAVRTKDIRNQAIARLGLLEASMGELVAPRAERKPGELHPEIAGLLIRARKAVQVAGNDPMLAGSIALLEGQAYAALGRWTYGKREYKAAIRLIQEARRQFEVAGDLRRAGRVAEVEAVTDLQRRDDRALDDALFAVRSAEEALERANQPRIESLGELRAEVAFARGEFYEASSLFAKLAGTAETSSLPERTGIVLDEKGAPVAGAVVVAWSGTLEGDPQTLVTDSRRGDLERATTAQDGTFTIHADPATAIVAGQGVQRSAPQLAGPHGTISLRLRPTRTLTGSAGIHAQGVVAFASFGIGGHAWRVRAPVRKDGTFSIGGLPREPAPTGLIGPAGNGTRLTLAGPNATSLTWPTGRAIEVIVRGKVTDDATVWIFRSRLSAGPAHLAAAPATRAAAEARAAGATDVAVGTLSPVGASATDNGLELYEAGDRHAVITGNPDGFSLACAAPGPGDEAPVTCAEVDVVRGAVFDYSDGRIGTDTQPVVIQLH